MFAKYCDDKSLLSNCPEYSCSWQYSRLKYHCFYLQKFQMLPLWNVSVCSGKLWVIEIKGVWLRNLSSVNLSCTWKNNASYTTFYNSGLKKLLNNFWLSLWLWTDTTKILYFLPEGTFVCAHIMSSLYIFFKKNSLLQRCHQ